MYAYEYKFDKCKATGDNTCRRQGLSNRRMKYLLILRSYLSKFINWWYKYELKEVRDENFNRILITIRKKLNREDIKQIELLLKGYYTVDFFNEIKNAVEITDTLKDVNSRDLDFNSDLLWAYQVILSDNTAYVLIFSDPYQDPWCEVKEYMKLEYIHQIKTPVKMEEKNIAFRNGVINE
jgi:hypothetical protein